MPPSTINSERSNREKTLALLASLHGHGDGELGSESRPSLEGEDQDQQAAEEENYRPIERPKLTAAQRKANHIASEQKRRQAIRDGFDRLCKIVPGLDGMGRSEGVVLRCTLHFIDQQLKLRQDLVESIESQGGVVDPKYKKAISGNEDTGARGRSYEKRKPKESSKESS